MITTLDLGPGQLGPQWRTGFRVRCGTFGPEPGSWVWVTLGWVAHVAWQLYWPTNSRENEGQPFTFEYSADSDYVIHIFTEPRCPWCPVHGYPGPGRWNFAYVNDDTNKTFRKLDTQRQNLSVLWLMWRVVILVNPGRPSQGKPPTN